MENGAGAKQKLPGKGLRISSGVQALPWGLLAAFLPPDVDGLALKFKAMWGVPERILAIDLLG